MKRKEFIEKLKELDRLLLEEVDLELTDCARYHAHIGIEDIIDIIVENEDRYNY